MADIYGDVDKFVGKGRRFSREDLRIGDPDEEVTDAVEKFAYYESLHNYRQSDLLKKQSEVERFEAQLRIRLTKEHTTEGGKAPAIRVVDDLVNVDDEYWIHKTELITIKSETMKLKGIAKAFERKIDLIQTRAANRRT
jgi:hypothetical protein